MRLNEHTALVNSHILLVPYCESHVPRYHDWMKSEELQALTASEPLSLEEEYAMQRSWRTDADKLTFIACLPPPLHDPDSLDPTSRTIKAGIDDTQERMLGDINLFLTHCDDSCSDDDADTGSRDKSAEDRAEDVVGEIELMIAERASRRRGYGRAALLAFLLYIGSNLEAILREYSGERGGLGARLRYLRVKIGEGNEGSLKLFESVGFERTGEGANYFGEVEMRFAGERVGDKVKEIKGLEEVEVLRYLM